ncbi:MAG: hypothetical protein LDLANPLL_02835 [Turneriella sp.]|nr:hypothetical protein [Turneriella sp.]
MPTEYPAQKNEKFDGTTKTLGVLLIIFASLYLAYSLYMVVSIFIATSFIDMLPQIKKIVPEFKNSGIQFEVLIEPIKTIYRVQTFEKISTALISFYGLFAGVGLVQRKALGIAASLRWAYAALGYLFLDLVVFFVVVQPISQRLLRVIAEQIKPILGEELSGLEFIPALGKSAGLGSELVGVFFLAAFPLVVVIMLLMRQKGEAH